MLYRLFLGITATLLLSSGCGSEPVYPDRPIILICPWAAGGGTDRVSRQVAPFLEQELGVPVNVVNATGGAGVTGHARGAHARPDGHTLTMMTVELNMLHWRNLTEISWVDFEPVGMINKDPAALFVRKGSDWQDLEALTNYIKGQSGSLRDANAGTRPSGSLRASGTATGGIWHLALAGWLSAAKLNVDAIRWIPMNGAGPSLQELLSGGLDLVCCSLPEARTLLEAGAVRCLGVMSEQRVEGYDGVPTFRECGADWSIGGWRGIGLPKDTPQAIVDQVAQALQRGVAGDTKVGKATFPGLMKPQGFNVTYANPESFRESLDQTDRALGAVLKGKDFSSLSEGPVDSMRFPTILFTAMGAILLALLLRGRKERAEDGTKGDQISRAGIIHAAEAIVCVVLFVWFAEPFGFVLTSVLIVVYLLWRLGTRFATSLTIAIILVPIVYQLFANVLRVPLARGMLGW